MHNFSKEFWKKFTDFCWKCLFNLFYLISVTYRYRLSYRPIPISFSHIGQTDISADTDTETVSVAHCTCIHIVVLAIASLFINAFGVTQKIIKNRLRARRDEWIICAFAPKFLPQKNPIGLDCNFFQIHMQNAVQSLFRKL